MTTKTISEIDCPNYSIENIKDEIKALVEKGSISRYQRIYSLAQYIPPREWLTIEKSLELDDFFLRDRICDLLATEKWEND